MLKLMDHFWHGKPDSLRKYLRFHYDLDVVDGVLCYRDRIMVPASLRTKVLIARLDKVGRFNKLRRNTGKETPFTQELIGMHMACGKLPIWSSSYKYI
jgi:hypothetical protein